MRSALIARLILPAAVALGAGAFAQEREAFTESVVVFNTLCANCHEGQCSGRMSFDEAYQASADHIIRYYGPASGKAWLQRELFQILNYMKERCAYHPMGVPLPPQQVWHAELLDRMSTLLERNYFVPLGPLATGAHRLELELASDAAVELHLVSEDFERVVESDYRATGGRLAIRFSVAHPGNHYVRVYPREPARITRLAVVPEGQGSQ